MRFSSIIYIEHEIFLAIASALLLLVVSSQQNNDIFSVSMSGKKKQITISSWKGFKKFVVHRGETVAVEVGNPAAETVKRVKCEICEREFINTQGLGTHNFM